ncbi:MAG: hypothetical protein OXU45_08720 [Candidatus Melainabacteria bacterium]|nr:hypothetical protein [Candidatus Melainabacteria bacterium]
MTTGLKITNYSELKAGAGQEPRVLLGVINPSGKRINQLFSAKDVSSLFMQTPGLDRSKLFLDNKASVKFQDLKSGENLATQLLIDQGNSFSLKLGAGHHVKTKFIEGKTRIPSRVKLELAEGASLTTTKGKLNIEGVHYPRELRTYGDETEVTISQQAGKLRFELALERDLPIT